MRRREFTTMLAGAAAWPLAARAQRRMPMIGILASASASEWQSDIAEFREGLQKLGRSGNNVQIEERWAPQAEELDHHAAELVRLMPDVVLGPGAAATRSLQQATRTIPIVFANVPDPVAFGFVSNLARPGGNITGFANYEPVIAVKWLELLKQIAPHVDRVAFVFDPANPAATGYFREIEAAALSFNVHVQAQPVRNREEIEHALNTFSREPGGGLVVPGSPATLAYQWS